MMQDRLQYITKVHKHDKYGLGDGFLVCASKHIHYNLHPIKNEPEL